MNAIERLVKMCKELGVPERIMAFGYEWPTLPDAAVADLAKLYNELAASQSAYLALRAELDGCRKIMEYYAFTPDGYPAVEWLEAHPEKE